jgi:hypothetical protein
MAHAASRLAGDPTAFAAAGGDAAIQGRGKLQRHQRAAAPHPAEEAGVHVLRFPRQQPLLHQQAGGAQPGDAGAVHPRVRVAGGAHHAGRATSHGQRQRLGVRPPAGRGDGAADHAALPHHHAAHGWVGPGIAEAAARQGQSGPHV